MIYLAVLTVRNIVTDATETLYFATGLGWVSESGDTPSHTFFDPRLKQPFDVTRTMVRPGDFSAGPSAVSRGDVILSNEDGGLDYLINYSLDGRAVQVYRGSESAAFPGSFTLLWTGSMGVAEITTTEVRISLRDRFSELNDQYQPTKYLGNNALPAGLEGVEDLEGKPKPIVLGQVFGIAPPSVNTSKLIYQVHDGAITSLDAVYDRGVELNILTTGPQWTLIDDKFGATGEAYAAVYDPASGLFVAGGGGIDDIHPISTSPDGITWTLRDCKLRTSVTIITGIDVDDRGRFVAVGDQRAGVGSGPLILMSGDGVNWIESLWEDSPFATGSVVSRVVAGVGEGPSSVTRWLAGSSAGVLATSDNGGITWTVRTPDTFTGYVWTCAYGGGTFIIGGTSGQVETSPDGITWTAQTTTFGANTVVGAAYSPTLGRWAIIGAPSLVETSDNDGVTWTSRSGMMTTPKGVIWSADASMFMVIGDSGTFQYSADGIAWVTTGTGAAADTIPEAKSLAYNPATGVTLFLGSDNGVGTQSYRSPGWSRGAYSSEADLLDDTLAPQPGAVAAYLAGGYFRLGGTPDGLITADATEGIDNFANSVSELWSTGALAAAGLSGGDWSTADAAALWTLISAVYASFAVCGYWTSIEETTPAIVAAAIASSIGCWWGVDQAGVFRIDQLLDPAEASTQWTFRNDLDNAAWTKTNASITADQANDLDGALTADRLVEDSTGSAQHNIQRDMPAVPDNTDVVNSFLAKAGTKSLVGVQTTTNAGVASGVSVIDLTTGLITQLQEEHTLSVSAAVDGWYRIRCGWNVGSGGSAELFGVHLLSGGGALNYSGDGASYILLSDLRWHVDGLPVITPNDMVQPLERIGVELPHSSEILQYQRNWSVQADTAGAATEPHRAFAAREWREIADASVVASASDQYLLAKPNTTQSYLNVRADAVTEAARLRLMYNRRHDIYAVTVPIADYPTVDIGDLVELQHTRFMLGGGRVGTVLVVEPDARHEVVTLEVWI